MKTWPKPTLAETLAIALATLAVAVLFALTTCSPRLPLLDRIRAQGVLRVATVNSPVTYYIGVSGPTGFEYDVVSGFADALGVRLEISALASPAAVLDAVRSGRAHLGSAALAADVPVPGIRYSQTLRVTQPQLVYRFSGDARPKTWNDLAGLLIFPTGRNIAGALTAALAGNPRVQWRESADEGAEELLSRVATGRVRYTVADSGLVSITQRYHPDLRVAFAAGERHNIALAMAEPETDLHARLAAWLERLGNKELAALNDRHFGHIAQVGLWNSASLAQHVKTRLPAYRKAFEAAAAAQGFDWRLLAAVGYQESRWDNEAVSPTLVRGLMQLTSATADFLKVDRLNPAQSIAGAARYLVFLKSELPPEIPEPDRTWMTLAAYNMGLGHLLDARDLARRMKTDPNRWPNIRNVLPLLTQFQWFSQTRYGYARGLEAMAYVGNIRSYYDTLVWITEGKKGSKPPEPESLDLPPLPDETKQPLNIESPVL